MENIVVSQWSVVVDLTTKGKFKSMINEWKEASEGRDLFGLQGNVGALLMDFGKIIGMQTDEIYQLLK